jgi:hypothetical protein
MTTTDESLLLHLPGQNSCLNCSHYDAGLSVCGLSPRIEYASRFRDEHCDGRMFEQSDMARLFPCVPHGVFAALSREPAAEPAGLSWWKFLDRAARGIPLGYCLARLVLFLFQ